MLEVSFAEFNRILQIKSLAKVLGLLFIFAFNVLLVLSSILLSLHLCISYVYV